MLFVNYFLFLITGLSPAKKAFIEHHINGFAQGTTYHITYYSTKDSVLQKQVDSILISIDSSLSLYKPYSTISKFNNSEKGIVIDSHLEKVFKKASKVFYDSGGISDITVATLVDIWGFGLHTIKSRPDSLQISKALECTGFKKLKLQYSFLSKSNPCIKIDMNGIAQGYSVDVIANYFDKKGIKNYIIELGGEIMAKGVKQPSKERWVVGIEDPGEAKTQDRNIKIKNSAITTSGNYHNYLILGGKKYSHIIDPFSGYPVDNEVISVTIIAKDAITADAYDNVLLAMGVENGIKFAKAKNFEVYYIYKLKNGKITSISTKEFFNN